MYTAVEERGQWVKVGMALLGLVEMYVGGDVGINKYKL